MRALFSILIPVLLLSLAFAERAELEVLLDAARAGDVAQLEKAAAGAAALDAREAETGRTPLMAAAAAGHAEAVEVLLEKGADMRVADTHGLTPIHAASWEGWAHVVEALLRKGEAPDEARGDDGFTPLHRACQGVLSQHVETVAALLRAGADPGLAAADGRDCTAMAGSEKMRDMLKEWTEHELDVPALVAAAVRRLAGANKNKKAEKKAARALKACVPPGANTMFSQGVADAFAKIEAKEHAGVASGMRTLSGMVAAIGATAQAMCKVEEAGDTAPLMMAAQKLEGVLEGPEGVKLGVRHDLFVGGIDVTEAIEKLIVLHRSKSGAKLGRALAGFVKLFEHVDIPSSEL